MHVAFKGFFQITEEKVISGKVVEYSDGYVAVFCECLE